MKYNKIGDYEYKIGGADADYLTVKEVGENWGITARMVTYYCVDVRIKRALKKGNLWLVPADAEKPKDERKKNLMKILMISQ